MEHLEAIQSMCADDRKYERDNKEDDQVQWADYEEENTAFFGKDSRNRTENTVSHVYQTKISYTARVPEALLARDINPDNAPKMKLIRQKRIWTMYV